jgi:hypothetical protein
LFEVVKDGKLVVAEGWWQGLDSAVGLDRC